LQLYMQLCQGLSSVSVCIVAEANSLELNSTEPLTSFFAAFIKMFVRTRSVHFLNERQLGPDNLIWKNAYGFSITICTSAVPGPRCYRASSHLSSRGRRSLNLLKAGLTRLEFGCFSKVMISCKNGVCYCFNGMPMPQ